MNLRIAGVTVSVTGLDEDLAVVAQARFGAFASDNMPDVVLAASMRRRKPPAPRSAVGKLDARIDEGPRPETYRISVRGSAIEGDVDLSEGTGYVSLPPDAGCLEDFLTALYSLLLIRDDAIMVQAATPRVGHIVMLVVGESDPELPDLSERGGQLVVVRRSGDAFLAHPTPFGERGEEPLDAASPVSGVYLMRPGSANEVKPPQQGAALLELLNRVRFFGPPSWAEKAVDLSADLLAKRFIGEFRWRAELAETEMPAYSAGSEK